MEYTMARLFLLFLLLWSAMQQGILRKFRRFSCPRERDPTYVQKCNPHAPHYPPIPRNPPTRPHQHQTSFLSFSASSPPCGAPRLTPSAPSSNLQALPAAHTKIASARCVPCVCKGNSNTHPNPLKPKPNLNPNPHPYAQGGKGQQEKNVDDCRDRPSA